ncbi:class I SAM-dependent methyltransferase [Streptomyces sp. NPDC047315]|uniref:class I SAM-dependent methyltransferase n=1 Tax=Streptomyces sp. NPDC047315 TaxID=3155142 RepID=UPI0033EFABB7
MTSQQDRPSRRPVCAPGPHYGADEVFHRLLLGPSMARAAGHWEDGEPLGDTLDEAQERGIDRRVELAAAHGAARVLDLGCGWGTLLHRLTTVHGVERAVGLGAERTQASFISGFGNPRVSVRRESWAEHRAERPYDAAFCADVLERTVPASLGRCDRALRYRCFFTSVAGALAPGARLVLDTVTASRTPIGARPREELRLLHANEFGGGHLPHPREVAAATAGLLDVTETVDDSGPYAMSCRAWLDRLEQCRDLAVVLAGEEVVRRVARSLRALVTALECEYLARLRIAAARV